MPQKDFEVGSIVQLVSGGPQMTVTQIFKNAARECCWFDNEMKLHRSEFPDKVLITPPLKDLSNEQLQKIANPSGRNKKDRQNDTGLM